MLEGDDGADATDGGRRHHHLHRPHRATAAAFDSYFFACFHDIEGALRNLREVVDGFHQPDLALTASGELAVGEGVRDSTMSGERRRRRSHDWLQEKERKRREGGVGSALVAHLRHPFASPNDHAVPPASVRDEAAAAAEPEPPKPITHSLSVQDAAAFGPRTGSDLGTQLSALRLSSDKDSDRTVVLPPAEGLNKSHTYPPPAAGGSTAADESGPTGWLKDKLPSLLHPLRSSSSTKSTSSTPKRAESPAPPATAGDGADRPASRRTVRETIERNTAALTPLASRDDGGAAAAGGRPSTDSTATTASVGGTESDEGGSRGDFALVERSKQGDRHDVAVEAKFHEVFAMDKSERLLERAFLQAAPSFPPSTHSWRLTQSPLPLNHQTSTATCSE